MAVALVFAMMMALAVTAGAANYTGKGSGANPTTTIPVDPTANKGSGAYTITMVDAEAGHTFNAYRIFDGSISSDGKLGDISWAEGVNATAIQTALNAIDALPKSDGTTAYDFSKAPDVAKALVGITNADTLAAIADAFYAGKGPAAATANTPNSDGKYELTGLKAGYYLVTDAYTSTPSDGAATLSRNILAVVGDVEAHAKNDLPSVEKKILTPTPADANTAGIGDTVAYQITGAIPNYTGYTNYFYVINDTLSAGLTFDGTQNLVVKVGNQVLSDGDYSVQTGSQAAPYTFQVGFKNVKDFTIGDPVTVTYTATVNENAVIGSDGNLNTTDVIYSNNPNDSSKGDPSTNSFPTNDIPTGKSVEDKTVTYVAEIDLTKYADAIGTGNELAGATFTLTGTSTQVVGSGGEVFVANDDGAYWKLSDGSYTTTAPHGDIKDADGNVKVESNEGYYADTTQKYTLKNVTTYTTYEKEVFMQGTSGSDGKIAFSGLGAGTYTLTEVIAPTGYNTVDPIQITITITVPKTIDTGKETATYEYTSDTNFAADNSTGVYSTDIVDLSGTLLPSTGGIGTKIFYAMGAILVIGTGVMMVSKKRAGQ